jgi:hypothetical protein
MIQEGCDACRPFPNIGSKQFSLLTLFESVGLLWILPWPICFEQFRDLSQQAHLFLFLPAMFRF